jgi:PhzF family phenazine biosynthesis protein
MKDIQVLHYDAFTSTPHMGNPAGVVLQADHLSHDQMQEIAKRVGFNETVFVTASDHADLRLTYFTPGHEINLCGHATIASLYAMKSRGLLGNVKNIMIETNIGILPIEFSSDNPVHIRMKQGNPQFNLFTGDMERLFHAMGLSADEWDKDFPVVYGSTGTWTVLIPLKELASFGKMKPNNHLFPDILKENSKASLHPFCMSTFDKAAHMHARHFSSPYSGTVEDPITGTASGVMGAYYLTYIKPELNDVQLVIEQGQEVNRDGKVFVHAIKRNRNLIDIYISGTAVFVGEIDRRTFI